MVQWKDLFTVNIKNGNLHRLDSTPLKHTHTCNLIYFIFLPACEMGWGKTVIEVGMTSSGVGRLSDRSWAGERESIRLLQ